jgi:hypothetical protein
MSKFIKHVGKHGDRKVAVIFRELPGEEHMCLVVYTEVLGKNLHDPLISAIESDPGQSSDNLAEALNRSYTQDGQIILQVLHREGLLKKVQTSGVTMTPSPNQRVRLDELNSILTEMAKGEEAVRKLADIDASRGLQDPKDVARRIKEMQATKKQTTASQQALGDSDLAENFRQQAARMDAEARGLMAEAQRLLKEAASLDSVVPETAAPAKKTRAKKKAEVSTVVESQVVTSPAKKSTRTRKATVVG